MKKVILFSFIFAVLSIYFTAGVGTKSVTATSSVGWITVQQKVENTRFYVNPIYRIFTNVPEKAVYFTSSQRGVGRVLVSRQSQRNTFTPYYETILVEDYASVGHVVDFSHFGTGKFYVKACVEENVCGSEIMIEL